jgi:hypothetical protein
VNHAQALAGALADADAERTAVERAAGELRAVCRPYV